MLLNAAQPPVIMVLGDSLSAAYGISEQHGWVALLQQQLASQDYPHQVINISISGDTTHGGISRLPAALTHHRPDILILALGANDGLRGAPIKRMKNNLTEMVSMAQQQQISVLLVGMQLPPNYGAHYNRMFSESFSEVAAQQHAELVPFLLQKIAQQRHYFQPDDLHPTAAAQPFILDVVWPKLQPLL